MKQIKRLLCLALCLVLIAGFAPAPVRAETGEELLHSSGHFFYRVDGDTVTVTRGNFDSTCPNEGWPITVTIPAEIDGCPVTRIEEGAFWSWYALDTIYLPDTLEEIGDDAFKACENLVTVDMPHVISIGDYAFRGCLSLEVIDIPSSVEYMGEFVFWECGAVREISIGEVTGAQPDHILDYDYSSVFYEMGSPVTVKLGNVVGEFDTGYIYRDQLEELWVAKSVVLTDSGGMGFPSDAVIYGYTGSSAESFAEKFGCTFVPLDDDGTAEEPKAMELISVSPDRGGTYSEVEDMELTFNMTPGRNVYGGSIYIKDYATDETVLEIDWERINTVAVYSGNTVRLPGVLDGLDPGEYYVLIDDSLFTADEVTEDNVLYAFPGITQKEYWTFTLCSDGVLELENATFRYYSSITKETESYSFDYTDAWFFEDSTWYDHDLARMSIRMALAAARTSAVSIKDLFDTLELQYNDESIHYPTPTEDTIGYAIGSKKVYNEKGESITLIAVAVRGGGYKAEWADNFVLGTGAEHEGFGTAADEVVAAIREYISGLSDQENLRLWITGYSRAAAVSNLAAHELNDLASSGAIRGLSVDGIFAYCFECPRGIRSDDPEFYDLDENIFSIVNPVDLVPMVAPAQWSFERWGTTLYLPAKETSSRLYAQTVGGMKEQYNQILTKAGCDDPVEDYTGIKVGQVGFLRELTDTLTDHIGSQQLYYAVYQEDISETLGACNDGELDLESVFDALVLALPDLVSKHPELVASLTEYAGGLSLAHYPELCLAWMDAIEAEDLSTDARTRYVKINCPVDVIVYESNGDLAATILDGEISGGTRADAYIDTNGQKILMLPMDREFSVELVATGDGAVSFQIEEYDMASGMSTRVVNYYDIPIREGDQLDAVIGAQSDGSADYLVTDAQGNAVAPDSDDSGDAIGEYTLTVTADGSGTVTGGGVFLEGEYAIVTAEPGEGAQFLGWYNGEKLVSADAEYRFRVEEDLTLVGRFAREAGEPDDPEPVTNPFTDVKETDYFYEPVLWAVQNGITSGMSATKFMPGNPCTRGQVVTFLWRAAGEPEPASRVNPFTDVSASAFYYKAVLWAVEEGITTGMSATQFMPNNPCTRGQVVTFLHRAAGEPEPENPKNPFTDVKASGFYYDAVLWAVENGITTGMSATTFDPGRTCTRGQVVTFLYRAQ